MVNLSLHQTSSFDNTYVRGRDRHILKCHFFSIGIFYINTCDISLISEFSNGYMTISSLFWESLDKSKSHITPAYKQTSRQKRNTLSNVSSRACYPPWSLVESWPSLWMHNQWTRTEYAINRALSYAFLMMINNVKKIPHYDFKLVLNVSPWPLPIRETMWRITWVNDITSQVLN